MACLIIAELPNWRMRLTLLLGLLFLLGGAGLATSWVADYRERPTQTGTISQLARAVESDQVRRLVAANNREFTETIEGARFLILKEENESAIKLLRDLNVPEEHLARLEITVAAAGQVRSVEWSSALLCGVPVVILLLSLITGVYRRGTVRRRARRAVYIDPPSAGVHAPGVARPV
jgi:hypothetical protein